MDVGLRCTIEARGEDDLDALGEIISMELFAHGATAIGQESANSGGLVLVAGFLTASDARAALAAASAAYPSSIGRAEIESASDAWTISQRSGLRPTQIGPWHVRAPWDPEPEDIEPRFDIIIDPGSAFGHGAHPSTIMAIELMARSARPGAHLIDAGTGTGVIAIIAARMGLRVDAIESDPAAAEIAQHNIERNSAFPFDDVNDAIALTVGDAREKVPDTSVSIVVANVTLDVQREIAPTFGRVERVIVSGVLCRQIQSVRELYPSHRARVIRTHAEWASLDLVCRNR